MSMTMGDMRLKYRWRVVYEPNDLYQASLRGYVNIVSKEEMEKIRQLIRDDVIKPFFLTARGGVSIAQRNYRAEGYVDRGDELFICDGRCAWRFKLKKE